MRSVVIYTYFQSRSSDYNLSFFIKNELTYRQNIDYIIVINGYNVRMSFPELDNLTILKRHNVGYDYGGHNHALNYIKNKKYDYYFFMNSGVIGPIIPNYYTGPHWSSIFINKITDKVKLVGTTISCLPHHNMGGYGPKVEGFFFMTDNIGLELLKNQQTIFFDHPNKQRAIINGEYGMTKCIFNGGYTIDCMIPEYQNIDWLDEKNYTLNNNMNPSRANSFYGNSLNPYDVIFHKWFWHGLDTVNFDVIKYYVSIKKS